MGLKWFLAPVEEDHVGGAGVETGGPGFLRKQPVWTEPHPPRVRVCRPKVHLKGREWGWGISIEVAKTPV